MILPHLHRAIFPCQGKHVKEKIARVNSPLFLPRYPSNSEPHTRKCPETFKNIY